MTRRKKTLPALVIAKILASESRDASGVTPVAAAFVPPAADDKVIRLVPRARNANLRVLRRPTRLAS
jgi:hypothetical protein